MAEAKPKFTALSTDDATLVAQMRKQGRNLVDEYGTENGEIVVVFHDNPAEFRLPAPGLERRALTRTVKAKKFKPEPRKAPEPKNLRPVKGEEDEGKDDSKKSDEK